MPWPSCTMDSRHFRSSPAVSYQPAHSSIKQRRGARICRTLLIHFLYRFTTRRVLLSPGSSRLRFTNFNSSFVEMRRDWSLFIVLSVLNFCSLSLKWSKSLARTDVLRVGNFHSRGSQPFSLPESVPTDSQFLSVICVGELNMYVCKVICPKYLSWLDKRKQWGRMSSPFLTEPMTLWEYLSLHTQTRVLQIQLLSITYLKMLPNCHSHKFMGITNIALA